MREIVSPLDGFLSPFGRISGSGAFDPASLFAGGENGVWYEPSTTTAFRSTTDLTPCAVGQSCGLLLDKSQGAGYSGGAFTGLGSDLVTNGTFDTDTTGWVGYIATIAQTGGRMSVTPTDAGSRSGYQNITTVAAQTYLVSVDYDAGTASACIVRVRNIVPNGTVIYQSAVLSGTGTHIFSFVALGTTTVLELATAAANSGNTAYFDNATLQNVPGLHATQGTAAARPILRQTAGGLYYLEFDAVDDRLAIPSLNLRNATWDALAAYVPANEDFMLIHNGAVANTPWVVIGEELSGSSDFDSIGTPTPSVNSMYLDNVLQTPADRDEFFNAAQLATRMHGNFSVPNTGDWSPSIGLAGNTAFQMPGPIYAYFIREGSMDETQRSDLDTYLAGRVPA